jgi:hypothetical protein
MTGRAVVPTFAAPATENQPPGRFGGASSESWVKPPLHPTPAPPRKSYALPARALHPQSRAQTSRTLAVDTAAAELPAAFKRHGRRSGNGPWPLPDLPRLTTPTALITSRVALAAGGSSGGAERGRSAQRTRNEVRRGSELLSSPLAQKVKRKARIAHGSPCVICRNCTHRAPGRARLALPPQPSGLENAVC